MTLIMLLHEINAKFNEVSAELEPYKELPEVESFLRRRKEDLIAFEKAVAPYSLNELTGIVLNSLRERGYGHKVYGICRVGEAYFEVTKKVNKEIAKYQAELLREAEKIEKNPEMNFDNQCAIPDELTPEQLQEIFGE